MPNSKKKQSKKPFGKRVELFANKITFRLLALMSIAAFSVGFTTVSIFDHLRKPGNVVSIYIGDMQLDFAEKKIARQDTELQKYEVAVDGLGNKIAQYRKTISSLELGSEEMVRASKSAVAKHEEDLSLIIQEYQDIVLGLQDHNDATVAQLTKAENDILVAREESGGLVLKLAEVEAELELSEQNAQAVAFSFAKAKKALASHEANGFSINEQDEKFVKWLVENELKDMTARLAQIVYHETRDGPDAIIPAIAVVLNRATHPKHWRNTVTGVAYEGCDRGNCQFVPYGSLDVNSLNDREGRVFHAIWKQAMVVVRDSLLGRFVDPSKGAHSFRSACTANKSSRWFDTLQVTLVVGKIPKYRGDKDCWGTVFYGFKSKDRAVSIAQNQ